MPMIETCSSRTLRRRLPSCSSWVSSETNTHTSPPRRNPTPPEPPIRAVKTPRPSPSAAEISPPAKLDCDPILLPFTPYILQASYISPLSPKNIVVLFDHIYYCNFVSACRRVFQFASAYDKSMFDLMLFLSKKVDCF